MEQNPFFVTARAQAGIRREKKGGKAKQVSSSQINSVLKKQSEDLSVADLIVQTLPDIGYAIKIKVAATLSPKSFNRPQLNLAIDEKRLTKKLKGNIAEIIRQHFRTRYNLEKDLGKILTNALFKYGSHATLILPPNTIDDMIANGQISMESFDEKIGNRRVGIIGPGSSELTNAGVDIVDNPNLLRRAYARRAQVNAKVNDMIGGESFYGSAIKVDSKTGTMNLPNQLPANVYNGEPLAITLPPDSLVPVYDPADPSKHIGYYAPIRPDGNFYTDIKETDVAKSLDARLKNVKAGEKMVDYVSGAVFNSGPETKSSDYINAFQDKIREELTASVNNGVLGDNLAVAKSHQVYRLVMLEALQKRKVSLMYIPAEMISYIAFEYDSLGMGVGLIEKTKLYGSLRTMLMFADIMAQVKNSVGRTEVEIVLDDADPDHALTIETILHEFTNMETSKIPIGTFNPADTIHELHKAGYQVKIEGGEAFPNTKTNVTDTSRNVVRVSQDLLDDLKKNHHAGIGVPAELTDRALEGDFAVSSLTTNALWASDNMVTQEEYAVQLKDFICKYTRKSSTLLNAILAEDKDADVEEILDALEVRFPQADSSTIQANAEEYRSYSDWVDEVVESIVSMDMMDTLYDEAEDVSGALDNLRAQIAAQMKRDFLRDNNMMPELFDMLESESEPLEDRINAFNADMIARLTKIVNRSVKASGKSFNKTYNNRNKVNKDKYQQVQDDPEPGATPPATPEQDPVEEDLGATEDTVDDVVPAGDETEETGEVTDEILE